MTTEVLPENAAAKLAALIPAPDATSIVPVESSPTTQAENVYASVGGPAPPLHHLTEDAKKTPPKRTPPKLKDTVATSNSAKREIQKMVPAAVRVHVFKRDRHGKMAFVQDYSANDLSAQGSIEKFLLEYVVPDYDYGEFALYMQEPGKDLAPIGSVTIEAPLSHKRRAQGNGELKEILELFRDQQETATRAQAAQKDPIDQMRETMTFLKSMTAGQKEGGMDPMLMMMMMMQQQPKTSPPSGPDPILLRLLERMERMEESASFANMLPPPPPPPPPPDPMASLGPILQMMLAQQQQATQLLVAAMQSRSNPVEDLARLTQLTGATDDRMTTKDFLTMLPTIKDMIAPNQGKSSMAEALETMRSVKLLERELGAGQEGAAASSFWDFLKEFVHSDAGANIAAAITAQEGAKKLESRQQQRRSAVGAPQLPPPQAQPQPQEEQGLVIPESFREKYAPPINLASTPQERLEALIRALQHLGAYPEFRPYMAKIIGLMKENRKTECLTFIDEFLAAMVEAEALEQEPCDKALVDLDTYWTLVRQQLKMPDVPEVLPEGAESEGAEAEGEAEDTEEPEDAEEPEAREIARPAHARRNPDREVTPLSPTPEQQAAQRALAEARAREVV